jgi:hypothetical protein
MATIVDVARGACVLASTVSLLGSGLRAVAADTCLCSGEALRGRGGRYNRRSRLVRRSRTCTLALVVSKVVAGPSWFSPGTERPPRPRMAFDDCGRPDRESCRAVLTEGVALPEKPGTILLGDGLALGAPLPVSELRQKLPRQQAAVSGGGTELSPSNFLPPLESAVGGRGRLRLPRRQAPVALVISPVVWWPRLALATAEGR